MKKNNNHQNQGQGRRNKTKKWKMKWESPYPTIFDKKNKNNIYKLLISKLNIFIINKLIF